MRGMYPVEYLQPALCHSICNSIEPAGRNYTEKGVSQFPAWKEDSPGHLRSHAVRVYMTVSLLINQFSILFPVKNHHILKRKYCMLKLYTVNNPYFKNYKFVIIPLLR